MTSVAVHRLLGCLAAALLAQASVSVASALEIVAPSTFVGIEGCGQSQYAENVTLTLRPNQTFALRVILNGREQFQGTGSWHLAATEHELLLEGPLHNPTIFRVDRNRLTRIDASASSKCFEVLTRSPHVIALPGNMQEVTLTSDVWTLESLGGTQLSHFTMPRLRFESNGQIVGTTVCRALRGTYRRGGEMQMPDGERSANLTMAPTVSDGGVACGALGVRTERKFLNALRQAAHYSSCCSTLRLLGRNNAVVATFRTSRS